MKLRGSIATLGNDAIGGWQWMARYGITTLLNNPNHLILEAPHPSPLSAYRGFFGCHHFSQANEFLKEHGLEPIDWQIENI